MSKVGAMGNGVGLPLMTLLFGDLIDSFGQNQNNKDIVDVISKVCVKFVYLGLETLGAAFLQVACWMITGERQAAARIRNMYLKTILRQDIGFFDVETNTGEVVGIMSGDTVLIQDAMGEKVGKFIQLIATFIGGFALAFAKGWLLTLVMLTSIPLLAMAGAAMAIIVTRASSQGQAAYAKQLLLLNRLSVPSERSYALAIWFGGKMILEKGYTGGAVINVLIIVVAGAMSSTTWEVLRPRQDIKSWMDVVWSKGAIPKLSFNMWVANYDRLPTRSRLAAWGLLISANCLFCSNFEETRDHLLLSCEYSKAIWREIFIRCQPPASSFANWSELLSWIRAAPSSKLNLLRKLATQTVVYHM
ncbi:hypothetical protein F2Q69_00000018 [Brassica cretica]|uniref:ABC transmembrane type-1 domain-containing protein n=1 Tax=Brassica cretica TaxID=69181 RepID=A0A8S9NXJ7_BRACR|nr:hypothetical protein F2Q69_00000018 [Brassica cretica]